MRLKVIVACTGCLLWTVSAQAQPIDVGPGFGETTQAGVSGGPRSINEMGETETGYCAGSVGDAASPNFVLNVTAPMAFLNVFTQSDGDPTLMIVGPDGTTYCSDDHYGLNPSIQRAFNPGLYQVWVGEYGMGSTSPYTAFISEDPHIELLGEMWEEEEMPYLMEYLVVPPMATEVTSPVSVAPGFVPDPIYISGTSGGEMDFSATWPSCMGWGQAMPQATITVTANLPHLFVGVVSDSDPTLAIVGPTGVICNDDYIGLNSGVEGEFQPGEYTVFVGEYSMGSSAPFQLLITELDPREIGAVATNEEGLMPPPPPVETPPTSVPTTE